MPWVAVSADAPLHAGHATPLAVVGAATSGTADPLVGWPWWFWLTAAYLSFVWAAPWVALAWHVVMQVARGDTVDLSVALGGATRDWPPMGSR